MTEGLCVLSNQQFDRTRRLALNLAGIELSDRHRGLLEKRSARVGIHEADTLETLLKAAEAGDPSAKRQLLGLLTTNFTGFLRHPRQFELAAQHAVQAAHQRGNARLWSAATATGEEAYSLAMVLIDRFERNDPPASVLGTDIDSTVVAVAQQGEYSDASLRILGPERRARFFTETNCGRGRVIPVLRALVDFRELNLTDADWKLTCQFDVIFCRNVLMYLEACHRYAVLERMASMLVPGGMFALDPTEHLGKAGHWFTQVGNGVYLRKKPIAISPARTQICSVVRPHRL